MCVCVFAWKFQQLVVWIWKNDWHVVVTQDWDTAAAEASAAAAVHVSVCVCVDNYTTHLK